MQEVTHLGIKMTATGNFNASHFQSKEKALQAFFGVTRTIDFKKLIPKQANKHYLMLLFHRYYHLGNHYHHYCYYDNCNRHSEHCYQL